MINSANIRSSIESLLAGSTGVKRKITSGTILKSHDSALEGLTVVGTRYNLEFGVVSNHPSTPFSILSDYRLVELPIEIRLSQHLPSQAEETARDTVRGAILATADAVAQAVGYPGNLLTTSGGAATGIIGGLCSKTTIGAPVEDWEKQVISCTVSTTAVVKVDQAT